MKAFIINSILAFGIIVACIFGTLNWIDSFTLHGESIEVPLFQHMTYKEASEVAKHRGLKVTVIDSMQDLRFKPGCIVDQYPREGARVKSGRTIQLNINTLNSEKVAFPDLRNAAFRQTVNTLTSKGLVIGKLDYQASRFKNLVLNISQDGKK